MNYKEIAKQGRYGDTELRIVDGQPSHVNVSEARDIDLLGQYGEMTTQLLGSGTANPFTGLPEYWSLKSAWNKHVKPMGKMKGWQALGYVGTGGMVDISGQGAGTMANLDSEGNVVGGSATSYASEKLLGEDYTGYSGWQDKMFSAAQAKATRLKGIESAGTDFDQKAYVQAVKQGKGDQYLQGIGITDAEDLEYFKGMVDKERIDIAGESRQAGTDTLAASTGQNLMNIYGQQEQAEAQSGFESSGAISSTGKRAQTSAFAEHMRQKKDLDRGYRETMMGIGDVAGDEFYDTLDTLEESITG